MLPSAHEGPSDALRAADDDEANFIDPSPTGGVVGRRTLHLGDPLGNPVVAVVAAKHFACSASSR